MPLDLLAIVGDAVWIFAMATIAAASRTGWRKVPADARLPLQWGLDRKPTWRAGRGLAFGVTLGVPLVFGLILSAIARRPDLDPSDPLLLFLVRLATAPLFVLLHLFWMRAALRTLEAEGTLKP